MSYAIHVGENHTRDNTALIGGYDDEPSSHWLEVVPRTSHSADLMVTVGVTELADLPGRLSKIPEVAETARHLRVSYSYHRGLPGPLTNGGLNEHGVAVRDVWSPSRAELIAITPRDQTGPNYSDLARMVVERARTAREGVMWHAPVGPVTALLVPVFMGQTAIPPEFGPHRYLTAGECARFLDERFADERPDSVSGVAQAAEVLCDAGEGDLAVRLLIEHSRVRLLEALADAEVLVALQEARLRLSGQQNASGKSTYPKQIW